MRLIKDFSTGADYTLTDVTLLNGAAELTRYNDPQTHTENFNNDNGFTMPTSAEVSDGLLRQKDFYANVALNALYNLNGLNADSYAGASGTPSNTGATATDGNGAAVFNGGQYLDYPTGLNTGNVQKGAVNLVIERTYTGVAQLHSYFIICNAAGSGLSALNIYHDTSGTLYVESYTSAGAVIDSFSVAFSPVLGQRHEIEYNWDYTTGTTYLFIDGVSKAARTGKIGTRGTCSLFRVGANQVGSRLCTVKIHSFTLYTEIQHTTDYTPKNSEYHDYIYKESAVGMSPITYNGAIDGFKALTALTATTETNSPRYTIGGYYWNGSAWAVSSDTYATASSASDLNANLATFPAFASTTSLTIKAYFQKSNTRGSVSALALSYYGELYDLTGTAYIIESVAAKHVAYLHEETTIPEGTQLKVAMEVNGTLKYHDGTAWVDSDGSLAQTNTFHDANGELDLLLERSANVRVYLLFYTADATVSPSIDNLIIVYHEDGIVTDANTCLVYGYLKSADGAPIVGATVTVNLKAANAEQYFEAGGSIIEKEEITATTDADGYWEMDLIRSSEFDVASYYELTIETTNKTSSKYKNEKSLRFKVGTFAEDGDSVNITEILETI